MPLLRPRGIRKTCAGSTSPRRRTLARGDGSETGLAIGAPPWRAGGTSSTSSTGRTTGAAHDTALRTGSLALLTSMQADALWFDDARRAMRPTP